MLLSLILYMTSRVSATSVRAAVRPGNELQQQLDTAVRSGASSFTIEPYVWKFGATPLQVIGAKNLTISAAGATLLFEAGKTVFDSGGVMIRDCENVTVVGSPDGTAGGPLILDDDPLPWWQGQIASVSLLMPSEDHELRMLASEGMPPLHAWWPSRSNTTLSEVIAIFWHGPSRLMSLQTSAGVHSWQFEPARVRNATGESWCDRARAHAAAADAGKTRNSSDSANGWSGNRECSAIEGWAVDWQTPNAGDYLTLSPLVGYTYNIANSTGVQTRHLDIYAASNKAITEFDGGGGHSYDSVRLIRKPGSDRLLAANSDAFHSSGCRRGPHLANCELSWSGDDFFNVHNTLQILLEAAPAAGDPHSSHALVVEPLLAHMWELNPPLNSYYGTAVQFEHVKAGSSLSFYVPENSTLLRGAVPVLRNPVNVTDRAVIARAQ